MRLKNQIGMAVATALGVLATTGAQAQTFPGKQPVKLIVPMLERFIATDRGFTKARRQTTNGQLNDGE